MHRRHLTFTAGLAALTCTVVLSQSARAGDDWKDLFNGKDLKGWSFQVREGKKEKADPKEAFTVKDGEIQITGEPWGYMYSKKSLKNYVLSYTWSFPKKQPEKTTMNTGLLIHIQKPHKVWPHSVEPQGRYMDHGKIFFIGFNKKKQKMVQDFDAAGQKKALKPSHEWNTTEVTARGDGSFEVRINGQLINKGSSSLTEGPIGFQSEGSRFHIKSIKVKMLN